MEDYIIHKTEFRTLKFEIRRTDYKLWTNKNVSDIYFNFQRKTLKCFELHHSNTNQATLSP